MLPRIAFGVALFATFVFGMVLGARTFDDDGSSGDSAADASAATTSTSSSTTSTTSTTTTTTTTVPPPREASLLFTGDLLPHGAVVRTAASYATAGAGSDQWNFVPMFAEVQPIIEGVDLAICHIESPVSYDDTNLSGYPTFNAPRALAQAALDVGYDGCSLASNHSYDRSARGVEGTLDALDEIGLPHAGMARSEEEDLAPVLYEVNDIVVAHISATYSLNGFAMPSDRPFLVDLIDPEQILIEAGLARAAGADFVVVSLHWGNEYRHEPTSAQDNWLAEILPSPDVDLVIGHHAHVVQPVDKVEDEWVVFGLGNFLSNQSANCCVTASQDGMIATVQLLENDGGVIEAVGVHYIPTWVDRADGYVIRIAQQGRTDVSEATASTLDRSWDRTHEVVSSRLGPDEGLSIGVGLSSAGPEDGG